MSREANEYIRVFTGRKFWPLDPHLDEIDILDIAHALANNCRWGGHCAFFYSIAQHCCLVHDLLPHGLKLAGLLHDASEAYILDMPRPIKYQMPQYREIEENLMNKIGERFNIFPEGFAAIKGADDIALYLEKRSLFNDGIAREVLTDKAVDFFFDCGIKETTTLGRAWLPHEAEQEFMDRFYAL